jgi:hypothetical protein
MNPEISKHSSARRHARRLATLFLLLCACLPAAQAKDRKPHASSAIKVVASMALADKPPADMQIKDANGKTYLYVQLANAQGVVVVDVTKADKPKIVGSIPSTDGASLVIRGNAAMVTAAEPDREPAAKGELVLWDISDPRNPRMVQRFSGVVRVLRDERNYTYVLNQEGLWVVYDNPDQPDDNSTLYSG